MLRKIALQLVFICLFAMVQAGVVTHEISHFQDIQHTQQDKKTSTEHCAQCLSISHAAGAIPSSAFAVYVHLPEQSWVAATQQLNFLVHYSVYAARAPPQNIQA